MPVEDTVRGRQEDEGGAKTSKKRPKSAATGPAPHLSSLAPGVAKERAFRVVLDFTETMLAVRPTSCLKLRPYFFFTYIR